jgi:hypothetical protein
MFSPRLPFLAMLFVLVTSASAIKPLIAGDTKVWKLDESHSDEFDAAGAVDAKKWAQTLGDWTGTVWVVPPTFLCVTNCHNIVPPTPCLPPPSLPPFQLTQTQLIPLSFGMVKRYNLIPPTQMHAQHLTSFCTGAAPGVFNKGNVAVTAAKELVLTTKEVTKESAVSTKKVFDGECLGAETLKYSHKITNNENPGKTEAERVQKCAEACVGVNIPSNGNFPGGVAKGIVMDPTGVCWCEPQDSSTCKRNLDTSDPSVGYDRYDFVKSDTSSDTCGSISTPLVVSSDPLSFGYYEIRAKMAKASILSSIFLQSTSGGGGEITILDTVPASAKNGLKVSNSYHCFDRATGATTKSSEMKIAKLDPSDGFHTYGVDRGTDGVVRFYVDGALARTLTVSDASCLQQPMKLVFSMVTATAEGVPSKFNAYTSHIEYFRHYTLIPAAKSGAGELKTGDEDVDVNMVNSTAAATITTAAAAGNTATDANIANKVFQGIIATALCVIVYMYATRTQASSETVKSFGDHTVGANEAGNELPEENQHNRPSPALSFSQSSTTFI